MSTRLNCHLLPAITLYLTQQNWKCLYTFVIGNIRNFTSQMIGVVRFLGNLDFFSPLGTDIQRNSGNETSKIKLYSVRALNCHLNEKNLIHGRVKARISNFSA